MKPNKIIPEPTFDIPQPPSVGEDFRDPALRGNVSKFEGDLFKEEDDIVEKVIRVKRTSLPNKGERWRIFENNKLLWTIEGNKISKKEREYLQTIDGFNFILSQAKIGIKSLNGFRQELKKIIKKPKVAASKKQTTAVKSKKSSKNKKK